MKLYNSLSRKIEDFEPQDPSKVKMYTCGPTVYFYPHIGNWRTFVLGDLLHRTFKYLGYGVDYLMNITDVGHLTGDNLGDSSQGEDRLEKGAKREGKTAWDVARFYSDDFKESYKLMGMLPPMTFCVATEHILQQIEMIKKIEEKSFTYKLTDGIYFDVGAYVSAGNEYGLMSNIHIDKSQARIEENKEKRDPRDFALWKFSPEGEQRQMEWDSPWGKGFPGWHIECSAMSTKYLGEQFDVHVGGEDHKSTHHPNEIAQAETASGKKPFVRYWVHGAFLKVDGGRMGKSLGNAYTLHDVTSKGFNPFALRYFYMTAHYRDTLNFTWESLKSAQKALDNLYELVANFKAVGRNRLSEDKLDKVNNFQLKFKGALENDLNLPQAVAVLWEVAKSNIPNPDKLDLFYGFDEVLGLDFRGVELAKKFEYEGENGSQIVSNVELSSEIISKINTRNTAKINKDFELSDNIREELAQSGYQINDTEGGVTVHGKNS